MKVTRRPGSPRRLLLRIGVIVLALPLLVYLLIWIALTLPWVQRFLVARFAGPAVEVRWQRIDWFPGGALTVHQLDASSGALRVEEITVRTEVAWGLLLAGKPAFGPARLSGGRLVFNLDELPPLEEPKPNEEAEPIRPPPVTAAPPSELDEAGTPPVGRALPLPVVPAPATAPRVPQQPEPALSPQHLPPQVRFLTTLETDDLDVAIEIDDDTIAEVTGLELRPADNGGGGTLHWDAIHIAGEELIKTGELPWTLEADGPRAQGKLPCLGGRLGVDARWLVEGPAQSAQLLRFGWSGEPGPDWQSWVEHFGAEFDVTRLHGQAEFRGQLLRRGSGFKLEGLGQLRDAGFDEMKLVEDLALSFQAGPGGTIIPILVLHLAEDRGWLLGNGLMNHDGQSLWVVRYVSGSDLGLGWIDPRANEGKWIAGFQPLTDPSMWYRDVHFAGSLRAPLADLLEPGEFASLVPQIETMRQRLVKEGAPLGLLHPEAGAESAVFFEVHSNSSHDEVP